VEDSHTSEDLNLIDSVGQNILPVDLNNRKLVAINGKDIVRIARNQNQSESITLPLLHAKYFEIYQRTSNRTALAVD